MRVALTAHHSSLGRPFVTTRSFDRLASVRPLQSNDLSRGDAFSRLGDVLQLLAGAGDTVWLHQLADVVYRRADTLVTQQARPRAMAVPAKVIDIHPRPAMPTPATWPAEEVEAIRRVSTKFRQLSRARPAAASVIEWWLDRLLRGAS